MLFLVSNVHASATRTIEADTITSSDKTKSWPMPSTSGAFINATSTTVLTNKSISGTTNTLSELPIATQSIVDAFFGNSVTTAFTLSFTPPAAANVKVFLDGVLMVSGSGNDYTLATNVITMTTAPATGQNIQVLYSRY